VGAFSALALFASVVLHELSHCLVARARGLAVQRITLFIFGGISTLKGEAQRAWDEFLVGIVGPLTSFALAAAFWAALRALSPGDTPLGAALAYLAFVNLLLGIFNLLPGFPLDGGRVLRPLIWAVTGSFSRATTIAAYIGQLFGFLLILWGVSHALGGDILGGLWIAFIGWFLNGAAEAAGQQEALAETLRGVRVADVMNPDLPLARPETTVAEFVYEHAPRRGRRALLVVDDGALLGLVTLADTQKAPETAWGVTPVRAIMTSAPLKTIAHDADVQSAVQLLADGTLNQLPVVKNGELVGLLTRADIVRLLQLRQELHLRHLSGKAPGSDAKP
jgi:Zn-dependent protease